jgi:5'-phosphate synthase pdxT subunit
VRTVQQLEGLDGLVLPGGESTAMAKIATRFGAAASGGTDDMLGALRRWVADDARRPVWGTCAGLIFLADRIVDGAKIGGQSVIGGLDVGVSRNFFGKQISSFEAYINAPPTGSASDAAAASSSNTADEDMKDDEDEDEDDGGGDDGGGDDDDDGEGGEYLGIFIRAPAVLEVGKNVTVLATVSTDKAESGSVAVAVEQDHLLATAFHPELTEDLRWHKYFVDKCRLAKKTLKKL